MKKLWCVLCLCFYIGGCMFYTNGYENLVNLSASDFSEPQKIKRVANVLS